ncbi:hypothetical protein GCM10025864_28850 [Luteimicrobium album]|uniref:Uncharacterized protein n=1 Tax=Luteimicrobium album TaxID=1054550 RepID=A0ABQ6I4D2_9MICO|nr:hypothetical protein [Luteimicrobium album]GMA25126.1 hypothetical protein GCM10025864_28850 [Luteimicrobium album]
MKLPTALTLDAAPEPAAVGETLTVNGKLTRYGQSTGKYAGYSGRKVDVYFDPAGAAPHTKVGTATTDASGRFTKKVTAKTTGVWSAEYAGSTYYAAVRSAGDSVTVVKKKTRVSADASPEPVKKGAKVTVAGRLTHATAVRGTLRYTSYPHMTLTVWFDPAGAKGASKVATVTTSSSGTYSVKRTQSVAGTWSVRFAGTPSYAASAGKDTVAVK